MCVCVQHRVQQGHMCFTASWSLMNTWKILDRLKMEGEKLFSLAVISFFSPCFRVLQPFSWWWWWPRSFCGGSCFIYVCLPFLYISRFLSLLIPFIFHHFFVVVAVVYSSSSSYVEPSSIRSGVDPSTISAARTTQFVSSFRGGVVSMYSEYKCIHKNGRRPEQKKVLWGSYGSNLMGNAQRRKDPAKSYIASNLDKFVKEKQKKRSSNVFHIQPTCWLDAVCVCAYTRVQVSMKRIKSSSIRIQK